MEDVHSCNHFETCVKLVGFLFEVPEEQSKVCKFRNIPWSNSVNVW